MICLGLIEGVDVSHLFDPINGEIGNFATRTLRKQISVLNNFFKVIYV
jgi:hypothetical protein